MICPNCGAQNRDDAKFCKACGTPFSPRAPHSAGSLATVASPTSTETKSPMTIGLEAIFLSGLRKGERVTITTFPATIGRDPNSTLPLALQDQLASTRHAQIAHEGSEYLLRDVGSSNGTYHNGSRVTEVRLRHEDVIEFGVGGPKIRFDFIWKAETKPPAAADRFEAATLPPTPALSPLPSDVTISRKSTVPNDAAPPAPPLPLPPPAPFESGATVVQGDYGASSSPMAGDLPPATYGQPAGVSPSALPLAPPDEAGGGKSRLFLFIAIGAVIFLFLAVAAAVAAYFILFR